MNADQGQNASHTSVCPLVCAPNTSTRRWHRTHFSDLEAEAPEKACDLSQRTWDSTPAASDSKNFALLALSAPATPSRASTVPYTQWPLVNAGSLLGQWLEPKEFVSCGPRASSCLSVRGGDCLCASVFPSGPARAPEMQLWDKGGDAPTAPVGPAPCRPPPLAQPLAYPQGCQESWPPTPVSALQVTLR